MSVVKMITMAWMAVYCQSGGLLCHETPTLRRPPVQISGKASWYGTYENKMHGSHTANGEPFDPRKKSVATRTAPLDIWVLVENQTSGKSAWCYSNDRGPYAADFYGATNWGIKMRTSGGWVKQPWTNGSWGEKTIVGEDPGKWRAAVDLSIGCAKAVDFQHDEGFNHVRIRYHAPQRGSVSLASTRWAKP